MNKDESLAFMQKCIDNINVLTNEEIAFLQEAYMAKCTSIIKGSKFEVIPPADIKECLFEIKDVRKITIPGFECMADTNNNQWNYSMMGTLTSNQQSDGSLPYAA